ncbi:hypothetical protein [Plantactinospora sp. WMMB782]|uniref:hypothetical protein n=1 Tax=Plantactinospora sp. WMMB782 TaxID=3404121 RepID=UPI003B938DFF
MRIRTLASGVGALAVMVAGVLAFTGAAQAATIDGWTANVGTSVKAVDGVNVLVMDQSGTSAGTSLERVVAGNVHAELPISFTFRLDGADASCGGGAPRVYLLGGLLYGQVMSCPVAASDWVTVSAADLSWWSGGTNYASWAAAVVAHQGTPLGQVGLVFDNAAGKNAKALFKNLTLAGKRVKLGTPPGATPTVTASATASPTATATPTQTVEPTTTATASPTGEPTSEPTAGPSESADPDPTFSPSPAAGGGGGDLPLTGAGVLGIGGAALLLVSVGGLLFVLARRRRTRFEV